MPVDMQGAIESSASDFASAITPAAWIAFGSLMLILLAVSLVMLFVGSAVELGYNRFNISLYERADNPPMSELFSRFSIYGRALWLRILMGLKIFAWSLLFIIPGVIAAFRYAMAPYILAENPDLTASEAINKSKELMNGHKVRLWWLQLTFIGWILLAGLTFGLGIVFLQPYIKAAETAFYLERTGRLPVEVQAEPAYSAPQAGTEQL